jgi:hypothetical protein
MVRCLVEYAQNRGAWKVTGYNGPATATHPRASAGTPRAFELYPRWIARGLAGLCTPTK